MRPRSRCRSRCLAQLALLTVFTFGSACSNEDTKPKATQPAPADKAPAPAPVTPWLLPEAPTLTSDSTPVTDIGEVVATVQLPHGKELSDIGAALDSVKPGTAAQLRAQLPMLLRQVAGMSLDGVKLSAPISIIVLDPKAHAEPVAMLVEVDDPAKLRERAAKAERGLVERDGFALIGPPAVVSSVEAFAFAHLREHPDHSELVVYPAPLVLAFGPEIDQALDQMGGAMMGAAGANEATAAMLREYVNGLTSMSQQTQRLVLSASSNQQGTELFLRAYPVEGTVFESFVTAQVPAEHALLARLPAQSEQSIVCSGDLRAGGAKDAIAAFSVAATASMYSDGLSPEDWARLMDAWLAVFDGRLAMTMDMSLVPGQGGLKMRTLFGSSDAAAMRVAWRAMLDEMVKAMAGAGAPAQMMGMGVTASYERDVLEHDGVSIDLYTTSLDLENLSEAQRKPIEAMGSAEQAMYFTTLDDVAVMASADAERSGASVRALIDAARGKGESFEPSGSFEGALAISKERRESLFFYMDLAAFTPGGVQPALPFGAIVMSMGKQGEALSLGLSLLK